MLILGVKGLNTLFPKRPFLAASNSEGQFAPSTRPFRAVSENKSEYEYDFSNLVHVLYILNLSILLFC